MDKQTISFRIESDKVGTLDALAEAFSRDRTYLLNEAVTAYLEVQRWHLEQIKIGLRQAEAGKSIDHARVRKLFGKRKR